MNRIRFAGWLAAICLIAILTCCGKAENTKKEDVGSTAEQADTEIAGEDPEQDSEQEGTGEEESKASTDFFRGDTAVCTQFFRLTVPEAWSETVTCHYFQEPEQGIYELDFVEINSMAATEGEGGHVFSIVVSEDYPDEPRGEAFDYLGTIRNENEEYHIYTQCPSGTQYTEGSEEPYKKILAWKEHTAEHLEGRNGYTFEAGEDPGETEE